MKFKSLSAGALLVGAIAASACFSAPAQALTFVYNETQSGDPNRNDLSTTADVVPDPLAATGHNLIINGTLQGRDTDWFKFTLNSLATLSTSFGSPHTPPPQTLQALLYQATDLTTPLQTLTFNLPGGTGGIVPGTFSAGTEFLIHIVGDGSNNPDYDFTVEAQAVPTPALLPGLIGMGMAVIRKRKAEAAMPDEAEV